MVSIVIFALLLTAIVILAFASGQAPEQVVAVMMTIAFLASVAQPYHAKSNYDSLFGSIFWIDVFLFVGITSVAALADRYWTLWAAASQLLTVSVHLAKRYEPDIMSSVYAQVSQKLGYATVLTLAIGIFRLHSRRYTLGKQADWSP